MGDRGQKQPSLLDVMDFFPEEDQVTHIPGHEAMIFSNDVFGGRKRIWW